MPEETTSLAPGSSTALTTPAANILAPRPEYIGTSAEGVADLVQYVQLPRIKVLQDLSPPALVNEYGAGAVIISPNNVCIAKMLREGGGKLIRPWGEEFDVVPVYFYAEYIQWNDRRAAQAGEDMILGKTLDPKHEIAVRSQSSQTRTTVHPKNDKWVVNYTQHLNFVSRVGGVGEFVVLSFSRGEHKTGRKFASLIARRNADMYAGRYSACVEQHASQAGRWWGLRLDNHVNSWVDKTEYAELRDIHHNFHEMYKGQRITTVYSDDDLVGGIEDVDPNEAPRTGAAGTRSF